MSDDEGLGLSVDLHDGDTAYDLRRKVGGVQKGLDLTAHAWHLLHLSVFSG